MKIKLGTADTLNSALFIAWGNSKYSSGARDTPGGGAPFWMVNRELLEVTNLLDLFPQIIYSNLYWHWQKTILLFILLEKISIDKNKRDYCRLTSEEAEELEEFLISGEILFCSKGKQSVNNHN